MCIVHCVSTIEIGRYDLISSLSGFKGVDVITTIMFELANGLFLQHPLPKTKLTKQCFLFFFYLY